jgi:hypothetical protein
VKAKALFVRSSEEKDRKKEFFEKKLKMNLFIYLLCKEFQVI